MEFGSFVNNLRFRSYFENGGKIDYEVQLHDSEEAAKFLSGRIHFSKVLYVQMNRLSHLTYPTHNTTHNTHTHSSKKMSFFLLGHSLNPLDGVWLIITVDKLDSG